jgi:hypothetical protein
LATLWGVTTDRYGYYYIRHDPALADLPLGHLVTATASRHRSGPLTRETSEMSPAVTVSNAAPRVVAVLTDQTANAEPAFAINTLPASGIQLHTVRTSGGTNRIIVRFSKDVQVIPANVSLQGDGGDLPTDPFIPLTLVPDNSDLSTVTWTFPNVIADQLVLRLFAGANTGIRDTANNNLDGEWVNPNSYTDTNSSISVFPSGNGVAGGNFEFRITVVRSDLNRNGAVNGFDIPWLVKWTGTSGEALLFEMGDIDGNGAANGFDYAPFTADLSAFSGRNFAVWPGTGGGQMAMSGGGGTSEEDLRRLESYLRRLVASGRLTESQVDEVWKTLGEARI